MAASNLNIQRAREIAAGSNSPAQQVNQVLGKTNVSPAVADVPILTAVAEL